MFYSTAIAAASNKLFNTVECHYNECRYNELQAIAKQTRSLTVGASFQWESYYCNRSEKSNLALYQAGQTSHIE